MSIQDRISKAAASNVVSFPTARQRRRWRRLGKPPYARFKELESDLDRQQSAFLDDARPSQVSVEDWWAPEHLLIALVMGGAFLLALWALGSQL